MDTSTEPQKRKRKRPDKASTFSRGPGIPLKGMKDKKLKGQMKHSESIIRQAEQKNRKINQYLLPEDAGYIEAEGMERTWRFQQADVVKAVDVGVSEKVFDLQLNDLGPYHIDFTRNGRHLVLAGNKGHLAVLEWQSRDLVSELQVWETVRDVKFLHNELFFAAAQRKYVYIYDNKGVEVHCLKNHIEPRVLEFLPHHFLLASIGNSGILNYQDTSTGDVVATHPTKMGPCSVMRQNPWNAVLNLGHANGTVTMWTPNVKKPMVKMLCHLGPVSALAVDVPGRHMVTAGLDGQVKVWDVRMLKPMHAYFANSPATRMDISQRGLLAVAQGKRVQVWKNALSDKAQAPYMTHTLLSGALEDLSFCPYEDILGLGHGEGLSTMLVPGAGEPNFDSFIANPFQTSKQRSEQEVAMLLDKLQPDSIVLDPESIGKVEPLPAEVRREAKRKAEAANEARRKKQEAKNDAKTRMKGKNRPSKKHRKKQVNIIEERKPSVKQRQQEQTQRKKDAAERKMKAENAPSALKRFYQST